jgi:hypothetical protein
LDLRPRKQQEAGELHELRFRLTIIVTKSRIMRCVSHVRNLCEFMVGRLEEKRPLSEYRRRLNENINMCGAAFIGSVCGAGKGCCEYGSEPSGSVRRGISSGSEGRHLVRR